jgi:hypothetical protein
VSYLLLPSRAPEPPPPACPAPPLPTAEAVERGLGLPRPRDLADRAALLAYLAALHSALEGTAALPRKTSVDSGVGSGGSEGWSSPAGGPGVASLGDEEAEESAFASAFRKFSKLTVSPAGEEVSGPGGRPELVSRGSQTEESHLRSGRVRAASGPRAPPRPRPPAAPAPPAKQRLAQRLARVQAVRRRQAGLTAPFLGQQGASLRHGGDPQGFPQGFPPSLPLGLPGVLPLALPGGLSAIGPPLFRSLPHFSTLV